MAAELHVTPSRATDADGLNLSGAKWFFYQTGTTTPQSVYTTSALSVAHASPVVADAGGKFAPIYFNSSLAYRGVLKTSDEATTIYDIDPINSNTLLELAQDTGAGLIGSTDGNVQADINAAKSRLSAIETITPTGEDLADSLADLLRPIAQGPRQALVYNDADSVKVFGTGVVMGGFRFRGQYYKGRAPYFAMPATLVAEYNTTGCPVLSAMKAETWVAVFAVADSGDATATLRTMPFLRLAAPSGLVCNIIAGGENVTNLSATASHSWTATNNLAGAEVLIISENGAFSGKTTTVTANTSTSVTLANVHSLAAGDFILIAPPGWDHYVYLGSFYYDSTEVRNFYDTGFMVKAKMVVNTTTSIATGAFASATEIDFSGNISPLATGCIFASIATLSTASTGDVAEYFDGDSSAHTLHEEFEAKTASGNLTYVFSNIQMPFLYYQTIHYKNGGSLNASRVSGQLQTTGWFEP